MKNKFRDIHLINKLFILTFAWIGVVILANSFLFTRPAIALVDQSEDECEKLRKRLSEAEKALKDALAHRDFTLIQSKHAGEAYDKIKISSPDLAALIAGVDARIESTNN